MKKATLAIAALALAINACAYKSKNSGSVPKVQAKADIEKQSAALKNSLTAGLWMTTCGQARWPIVNNYSGRSVMSFTAGGVLNVRYETYTTKDCTGSKE